MGFKKIAVLCDVYEMAKSEHIKVGDRIGLPILKDRIFSLLDANKRNSLYRGKRRWLEIKWEETAVLQLKAGNIDWVEYVLEEKRLECKVLKRDIDFPVKDSYTEALDDGETLKGGYNDYIEVVERQIELIEGIEFKPKIEGLKEPADHLNSFEYGGKTIVVTEGMMDELKVAIKEEGLGIRVNKDDSYGSVYMKVEEARKSK